MERLIIQIDGDSTGLGKAVQSAENRLNSLNTRISNTSRSLTNLQTRMSTFGQSIQAMSAANLRMAASLNQVQSRLNSVAAAASRNTTNIRNTTKATSSLSQSLWDVSRKIAMINTLFFVGGGIFGSLVGSLISANSQMEKMNVLLKNMSSAASDTGKQLEAKGNVDYLWNLADRAPFAIEALTKTFVKLKAAGIDPTKGSMQALVDTVAFFGGSTDEMNRAGIALSQMLSKGKVTAEELRQQLGDAVPNAMKDMAEALDMTIPELDAKMKKGLVLSAEAVPKLIELWQKKYKGGAENMMTTWDGVMARMQNQWQKMIVRITAASGDNSFFTNMKKQAEDFTNFLNSKEGDEFFKNIQSGLSSVVTLLSSAVKFVYKYREELVFAGKMMIAYWTSKAIFSGIANIFSAVNRVTLVMHILGLNTSAAARYMLLFGRDAATAAKSLGLLNAAGQISLRFLGTFAAGSLAVGGLIAALIMYNNTVKKNGAMMDVAGKAQHEYNAQLSFSESYLANVTRNLDTLNIASEKERVAALNAAKAHQEKTKQLLAETTAAEKAALALYKLKEAELYRKVEDINNMGRQNGGSGMIVGGFQALSGTDKSTKKERDALAQAKGNFEAAHKARKNYIEALKTDNAAIEKYSDKSVIAVDTSAAGASDKDDKKKDKTAAKLETLRQRYIGLIVARKQYEHELVNGDLEDFDTDDATDAAEKEADKIKGGLEGYKTAINEIKDTNRNLRQDIKDDDVLRDLMSQMGGLKDQAHFLSVELEDGYRSLDNILDSIATKTQDKYLNDLKEANEENRVLIQQRINDVVNGEKKIAVLDMAIDYKARNRDIEESLMTEDELRESVYQREKARIEQMIEALSDRNDAEGVARQTLSDYLGNLDKMNQIKSNPFKQWAMDAKDLDRNVRENLVGSMDSFIEGLAEGKMNFTDFAASILKDLAKIIIRAMIARAIMSSLTGGMSAPTLGTGSGDLSGSFIASDILPVLGNHSGGIAGKEATFSRNVDTRMFKFAKRYHSGGFPGLGPNEVPIIAEKGEGVFTQEQMKALGKNSGGGSAAAPQVNIINQTSQPVSQETTSQKFDGEKWVVDIMLKHSSKPGPVRDMMKGMK